jgi:hypothetical protein
MAPRFIFAKLHLLCYLQMGPMSYRVTLHKAEKACQGQTLQLIEPICNLQRKCSSIFVSPKIIFKTLNLQMRPMSYSVALYQAEKTCQVTTLQLIDSFLSYY